MSRSRSGERPALTGAGASLEVTERKLADLVPYWRNPRRITDEAVNAVAESITRYGYRQPIVVDEHDTIVIGHTRYMALRRLGHDTAPVHVARGLSAGQIKQLRAVDNRTAEYNDWDFEKLADELAQLTGEGSLDALFEELEGAPTGPRMREMDDAPPPPPVDAEPGEATPSAGGTGAEFICPSCFHQWEQQVRESEIRKGRLEAEK